CSIYTSSCNSRSHPSIHSLLVFTNVTDVNTSRRRMQSKTSESDDVVLVMDPYPPTKPTIARSQSMKEGRPPKSAKPRLRRIPLTKPKARLLEYNYPTSSSSVSSLSSTSIRDTKYPPRHKFLCSESSSSSSSQDDRSDDGHQNGFQEEDDEEDDDKDEYVHHDHVGGTSSSKHSKRKIKKKFSVWHGIEWVVFIIIVSCIICSLTIERLRRHKSVWKWCVMVLMTVCGPLISGWVMSLAVFAIQRNFMLREKVLYFVLGLRKSIQNCVWLGLILLSWTCVFSPQLHHRYKLLDRVYKGLVALFVAAVIWLLKIVLVKTLASSFHVARYFDRMKESVFHQYVLDALSGPPVTIEEEEVKRNNGGASLTESRSVPAGGRRRRIKKLEESELRRLSLESTRSSWSMRRLVNYIMSSGLSTISKTVDDFAKGESEIGNEWEARNAAKRVFKNVAKPGAKYIDEADLMKFLKRIEIHTILPFFEGALETGKISKSSFRNWVVRAYLERKSLAHSLNDTRTAVQQLHKLASAVVAVIIVVVTILVMGLANLQVIFFVTTQLVVVGVIFQNMCRTVFESIVFVFMMHPFDIGDRCVVDGVQMVVEEMNILTTVFLRHDMEKIYYPNSILLTKPISNFYRSPEMSDTVEFSVDISTPMDTINSLRKVIQLYIESKPNYWNPTHAVTVREIEPSNLMKMALCVQHTINHQNFIERNYRLTELILELKNIFENLDIKYRLLPQEVHLTRAVNN
ncbi:Mechanosensitive ion channel protein 10, partial [Linum grandiflorum]